MHDGSTYKAPLKRSFFAPRREAKRNTYLRVHMLIVVNTRLLIRDRLDGIGRFTYETLSRITQDQPDHHFVFLFDRPIDSSFIFSENITPVKLFPPARRTWLFKLWFEYSVTRTLRDFKADLFLSPDGFLSLKSEVPSLPVIHDLNFEHYPQDLPPKITNYYQTYFPQFAHKARRIATVSEFSKNDIASRYKINPGLIDVVYNGASEGFVPADAETITAVRKKYSGGKPYFLFVGGLHPRKNIIRLLQAFDQFRKTNDSQTQLVIVGERYWKGFDLSLTLQQMQFRSEVHFTGRVPQEELYRIMGSAHALTYVPYFEGFGIPIVEAMQCDVPVITSNVTSMPEIGGDAVLQVDPFEINSIASGMQALDTDEKRRASLIEKAKQQREQFSWDKSADLLWQSIMRCGVKDNDD